MEIKKSVLFDCTSEVAQPDAISIAVASRVLVIIGYMVFDVDTFFGLSWHSLTRQLHSDALYFVDITYH